MLLSRRETNYLLTGWAAAPGLDAASSGWTADWDRAVLATAISRLDSEFDPKDSMIRRQAGWRIVS